MARTGERGYKKLDVEYFGKVLLESGDLDPVYIALNKAELGHDQLCAFLVAYWCMYDVGSAAWLSEQPDFWGHMEIAAANQKPAPTGGRWPRQPERRHWRGAAAMKSVVGLQTCAAWKGANRLEVNLDPAILVEWLAGVGLDTTPAVTPFAEVSERAKQLPLFGPWIAFKVGDMIDRCGIQPVSFDQSEVFMFDTPREAALMVARQKLGLPESAKLKDEQRAVNEVVAYLTDHFKDHTAPPTHDRPVGLQEIETILCKWKSHLNGHYPLGKDTREITAGLGEWAAVSETAKLLQASMPKGQANG